MRRRVCYLAVGLDPESSSQFSRSMCLGSCPQLLSLPCILSRTDTESGTETTPSIGQSGARQTLLVREWLAQMGDFSHMRRGAGPVWIFPNIAASRVDGHKSRTYGEKFDSAQRTIRRNACGSDNRVARDCQQCNGNHGKNRFRVQINAHERLQSATYHINFHHRPMHNPRWDSRKGERSMAKLKIVALALLLLVTGLRRVTAD